MLSIKRLFIFAIMVTAMYGQELVASLENVNFIESRPCLGFEGTQYLIDMTDSGFLTYTTSSYTVAYDTPSPDPEIETEVICLLNDIDGNGHPEALMYKNINHYGGVWDAGVYIVDLTGDVIFSETRTNYGLTVELFIDTNNSWCMIIRTANSGLDLAWIYDLGMSATSVDVVSYGSRPIVSQSLSGYPNPFNSSTTLEYDIQEEGSINIQIYDIRGRIVMTETLSSQYPGSYSYTWDGRDSNGHELSSGVYQVKMDSGKEVMTKSVVMVR